MKLIKRKKHKGIIVSKGNKNGKLVKQLEKKPEKKKKKLNNCADNNNNHQ
jgi:hypothetical protein